MPVSKDCANCGTQFPCKPSHYAKRVYCSRACMVEGYRARFTGVGNPNHRGAGEHTCATCGVAFHDYNKTRRYCSLACAGKKPENLEKLARICHLPRPRLLKSGRSPRKCKCATCGRVFLHSCIRKYCSTCCPKGKRILGWCAVCGTRKRDDNKTCSRECQNKHQTQRQQGDRSHLWRGGKTNPDALQRGSSTYAEWRSTVFNRDDFTCMICKHRGGKLAAHHIKTFKHHPELRLDVDNGITLCWPCHRSIRWKEDQFIETFQSTVKAQKAIDWSIPRAGYEPMDIDEVMRLAEGFCGEEG